MLSHLKDAIGAPRRIAVDNGPELISKASDAWAHPSHVILEFSRPRKPTDTADIKCFNGHFRTEGLDQHWFETIAEATAVTSAWRGEYNEE